MAPPTAVSTFPSRLESFERVASTNDVVMGWLRDGVPEVCVAVADEQTAGRGRNGRSWTSPAGAALLCSIGFTPSWLEPEQAWRLAAIVATSMAEAGEEVAGLPVGSIHLKWPNDLVVALGAGDEPLVDATPSRDTRDIRVRKLAGVLGETDGLGSDSARAVIGIGVNADWPRSSFPADIGADMTSLSELAPSGSVDRSELLERFLERLEERHQALRGGQFDGPAWIRRQVTNGWLVRLELPDGTTSIARALATDAGSGALVIEDQASGRQRDVLVGEVRHLRVGGSL